MPTNFLEQFNPLKLISGGLLNALPFILGTISTNLADAIRAIQDQVKAGTATREQVRDDIHKLIKGAEDLTPDNIDVILEIVNRLVDDAFDLQAALIPKQ